MTLWRPLWNTRAPLPFLAGPPYGEHVERLSRIRHVLECAECGVTAVGSARGWAAYLCDLDDDGYDEVLVYCPQCVAEQQLRFGD